MEATLVLVGASLLAIAVYQSNHPLLTRRYREQARSHRCVTDSESIYFQV